jgi:hypothetical protein
LTADEAAVVPRPGGWDEVEHRPVAEQVAAFEREGWDVTDDKRKVLRVFGHFNQQLWLAVRGVAGALPFAAEEEPSDAWGQSLASDAKRFRRR